jgi:hypothetical protein
MLSNVCSAKARIAYRLPERLATRLRRIECRRDAP